MLQQNDMDHMNQVDDKALEGDLDCLTLKDGPWTTSPVPSVDTQANGASLTGMPVKSDSGSLLATQEDLCEICRRIDFDILQEVDHTHWSPFKEKDALWSLGPLTYQELEASARCCKLCRFFAQYFVDWLPPDGIFEGDLDPIMISLRNDMSEDNLSWSQSLSDLCFGNYRRPYFVLRPRHQRRSPFSSLEDRIQLCRRPGAAWQCFGFRVPAPQVPFDLLRSWLDFCQHHHGPDCSEGGAMTIQSLRLIDCEPTARRIVPFSPELGKYAALSYVWGSHVQTENTAPPLGEGELPSILPRTIEDAVTVTLKLGLRYLWVDQFCIPRDNKDEMARQIRLMDEIYRGAELTIIASAGKDANHGLPGVNLTPRERARSVQVGVDTLVDMPGNAFSFTRGGATWRRRGWTYQEGILSRRRLVFAENQVYFQCADMAVWEALDLPLDLLHYEARPGS